MTNTVCCLFHRIAYFSAVLSAPTYFSIHLISMCRFFRILPHVLCCYIVIMHYSCNRMGVLFVGMNNKMQHKIQRQTTMTSMMPFTLRVGRERETEKEGEKNMTITSQPTTAFSRNGCFMAHKQTQQNEHHSHYYRYCIITSN